MCIQKSPLCKSFFKSLTSVFDVLVSVDDRRNSIKMQVLKYAHCANALRKRVAKTQCENALQKRVVKTNCVNARAETNCNGEDHLQLQPFLTITGVYGFV